MRKILTLFLALVVCTISAFAYDGANMEFTSTSHDFGTIQEANGAVTHIFEFTNTGNAKLIVLSAVASCGCTTPQFPQEPIKPGETGQIKVTYNPSGRPGEFDKSIKVRYNGRDDDHKRVVLKITGTVIPKGNK
jgi:hypothetical protein